MIINGNNYNVKLLNLKFKLHSLVEDIPTVFVDTIAYRSQVWYKGDYIGEVYLNTSICPIHCEVILTTSSIKVEVI